MVSSYLDRAKCKLDKYNDDINSGGDPLVSQTLFQSTLIRTDVGLGVPLTLEVRWSSSTPLADKSCFMFRYALGETERRSVFFCGYVLLGGTAA
jgi:hypothetical protein